MIVASNDVRVIFEQLQLETAAAQSTSDITTPARAVCGFGSPGRSSHIEIDENHLLLDGETVRLVCKEIMVSYCQKKIL